MEVLAHVASCARVTESGAPSLPVACGGGYSMQGKRRRSVGPGAGACQRAQSAFERISRRAGRLKSRHKILRLKSRQELRGAIGKPLGPGGGQRGERSSRRRVMVAPACRASFGSPFPSVLSLRRRSGVIIHATTGRPSAFASWVGASVAQSALLSMFSPEQSDPIWAPGAVGIHSLPVRHLFRQFFPASQSVYCMSRGPLRSGSSGCQ